MSVRLKKVEDSQVYEELKLKPVAEPQKLSTPKRFDSRHYHRVEDHATYFEVGSFYSKHIQEGKKFFAFYNDNVSEKVHKTIVELATFINFYRSKKVTIFVNEYNQSWEKVLPLNEDGGKPFSRVEGFLISEGIEIVELTKLKDLCQKTSQNYDEVLSQIYQESEVLFWEVSRDCVSERNRETFFPLWDHLEAVSIVVKKGTTKNSELNPFISLCQRSEKDILNFIMV